MKLKNCIAKYEDFCPQNLALADDPVGLQIGSLDQEVKKILVTLDIREQTVQEAIDLDVDMIFAKHPVIFRHLSALTTEDVQENIILQLAKANMAVYTSHTNIDVVAGGLNDDFCQLLSLQDVEALEAETGMARIGNIEPLSMSALTETVKTAFGLTRLRVISYDHQMNQEIKRVAICGGTGGKLWTLAKEQGADVFITGDIYYHTAHDMLSHGLLAIDPGHYIEHLFIPKIAQFLREAEPELEIFESQALSNPFYDI